MARKHLMRFDRRDSQDGIHNVEVGCPPFEVPSVRRLTSALRLPGARNAPLVLKTRQTRRIAALGTRHNENWNAFHTLSWKRGFVSFFLSFFFLFFSFRRNDSRGNRVGSLQTQTQCRCLGWLCNDLG